MNSAESLTERIDLYDDRRQRTGRVIERGGEVREGEHCLVVHLCLLNAAGELLAQKRSGKKDRYPGCWDVSAGGFARSGETSLQAVQRETEEELGLVFPEEAFRFAFMEPFSYVYDDFYIIRCDDLDPSSLHLQEEEVSEAVFLPADTVLQMIRTGEFVDYSIELMEKIFTGSFE